MMPEPLAIHQILRDHGLKPNKSLGQNFLAEDEFLIKISDASQVCNSDIVLEIGAGLGSLTRHLAARASEVVAVEVDRQLFPVLQKVMRDFKNVRLVEGDIMDLDINRLLTGKPFKVVANIPYYLTSNLIRRLLEAKAKPAVMGLTVQKEVAERICAKPGDLSLLALSVQVYGSPRIAFEIPAGAFFPIPDVDSAFLLVQLFEKPLMPPELMDGFFMLAKSAFGQKRKKLRNSLNGAPGLGGGRADALLDTCGIAPDRRAQTLSVEEWRQLALAYARLKQTIS